MLLSAILLLVVFRSLFVAVKAILMNLLSVAAAFGVVVAVFQWGWLGGVIGISTTSPIAAFLPVMVFAIVFGLSMDYEVFLMSRMHEEWERTGDAAHAVRHGLAATGRVITAAAAIMVCVFASFVLGDSLTIKLFGVGLASAVFLDAFLIRTVLVPALMALMGPRAWWLPSGLARRLPRLNVDPQIDSGQGARARLADREDRQRAARRVVVGVAAWDDQVPVDGDRAVPMAARHVQRRDDVAVRRVVDDERAARVIDVEQAAGEDRARPGRAVLPDLM